MRRRETGFPHRNGRLLILHPSSYTCPYCSTSFLLKISEKYIKCAELQIILQSNSISIRDIDILYKITFQIKYGLKGTE